MGSTIHHVIAFDASPNELYDELTDVSKFASLTGAPAELDPNPGGAFSLFGGNIVGRNVELVPGERVVQAWRAANWEPGLYSMVRFEFRPDGRGSTLVFDHTGFPEDQRDHLDSGWHAMYWDPMKKHLASD